MYVRADVTGFQLSFLVAWNFWDMHYIVLQGRVYILALDRMVKTVHGK